MNFQPMGYSERYLQAEWPASANVRALVTTRKLGVSSGKFSAFNLAYHVGDKVEDVSTNRETIQQDLELSACPCWLQQVHGNACIPWCSRPDTALGDKYPMADACYANARQQICAVMTADCLPILMANRQGNWVAACHAGWRGLARGVIQNTISRYQGEPSDLIAWIGPAISQNYFEVGSEVKEIFVNLDSSYQGCFERNQNNRYQFDFINLARRILSKFAIKVYGGNFCSFTDECNFYSYRRDGETGRMASLIWFE